jgi:hypothetical protein
MPPHESIGVTFLLWRIPGQAQQGTVGAILRPVKNKLRAQDETRTKGETRAGAVRNEPLWRRLKFAAAGTVVSYRLASGIKYPSPGADTTHVVKI